MTTDILIPSGATNPAQVDALLYPFETGALAWPKSGRVLFLRGRYSQALAEQVRSSPADVTVWQSFKPFADAFPASGFQVMGEDEPAADGSWPLVLVLPSRQREESRALMARALQCVAPGGIVVAAVANTEGARSAEKDMAALIANAQSTSKHKCRVFWATVDPAAVDAPLRATWSALDAPRQIAAEAAWSRPGLFAWDHVDAASALLAAHLPADLRGRGADLGAGWGYLSMQVLARCRGLVALDLYEAEARALAMARRNLGACVQAQSVALGFHWHDVSAGLPARYDFIVSNPPFHQGRADLPKLGQAFIVAAANALVKGGRFWLVANRHLPYESVLLERFSTVRTVVDAQGFKVIEAVKGAS